MGMSANTGCNVTLANRDIDVNIESHILYKRSCDSDKPEYGWTHAS